MTTPILADSPEVAGLGNFFGEIANSGKPPCGLATHRYLKSQPVMASGCSGRYATRSTLRNSAWFSFPTGSDSYRDDCAVTFIDSDLFMSAMALSQFSAATPILDPTPIKTLCVIEPLPNQLFFHHQSK
jgi:hypothetical protein